MEVKPPRSSTLAAIISQMCVDWLDQKSMNKREVALAKGPTLDPKVIAI